MTKTQKGKFYKIDANMKYKTVISRSKVKTTQYIFKQKKIKISRLMSLLLHYSIQNYHQPNSFYTETY